MAPGASPAGGGVRDDSAGDLDGMTSSALYGTASGGGVSCGVVYKVDQASEETVLYAFTGLDGCDPKSKVIHDADGNLYGTTYVGGAHGWGVVYKLDPATGTETVLHSFTGRADGALPYAGVVLDAAGNLYGTTENGGARPGYSGLGVVYKLDPATGTETVLHTFTGGVDGGGPFAGVILDSAGNLYGTTTVGGAHGWGVVYKLDPATDKMAVLHAFTGGADGGLPATGLIHDAAGNLYGTTTGGGPDGWGVVYKVDPATRTETVLHSFTGRADGAIPAGVFLDSDGNLYGTTNRGGARPGNEGYGVVYKLDPATGTETVLHSFTGRADGAYPNEVILDAAGNLYGTTLQGGAPVLYFFGVVYKVGPGGKKLTVLHTFTGAPDGVQPYAGLILRR